MGHFQEAAAAPLCAVPHRKTKPWIREFLLGKDDYHLWTHRYEFQQMVRSACEHFGDELLTAEERERILTPF